MKRDETHTPTALVKPLEWGAHPIHGDHELAIADAGFNHRYQVQRDPWGPGFMAYLHPALPITDSTRWWESKGHGTLEAAKAAAQADFEARILSALVAPAASSQERIAQLEAVFADLCKPEQGLTAEDVLANYRRVRRTALDLAEAAPAPEGEWIEWAGGEQPVSDDTAVDVRFRDGREIPGQLAGGWRWNHVSNVGDIIAYRVIGAAK